MYETLESYFDYQPLFDDNPQYLIDEIISETKKYLPKDSDFDTIQKAYEFARDAHKDGDKRLSGEPYIVHPVLAAKFLMKINPGINAIAACLLHDVIEDTPLTYNDVKNSFGQEIADLCEGMVKVGKVRYRGEERQIETLKKTFLAMGKDLRVIFIKFADRIHNLQTLQYHPKEEKRYMIAQESLKIFVPIAQRLGLNVFQFYLENASFKIINPNEYDKIINYIEKNYGKGEKYIERGVKMLKDILYKEYGKNNFEIKGRLKSPYRVYKKMIKYQTNDPYKIMDILAFRIITNDVANCYNILGILHSNYTPIIKRIKDYISIPKANGYKSLHTTLLGMFPFPVEIQIRTQDMDEIAEYGVAAHFAYKESGNSISVSEGQALWIKKLQELVKEFQNESDKGKFKNQLQVEFLDKNIFVYTPTGEIKELPFGSTVLDFAFRIHSDIGLRFKSAFVNGQIVPIDYGLKTGDIVRIENFKNKYTASKSWFDYLHTPSAKTKLNKFIKDSQKELMFKQSKEILNERLKEFGLPLIGAKDDKISKKYKGDEFENLMVRLLDKQTTPTRIIKEIYPEIAAEKKESPKHSAGEHQEKNLNYVLIDGDKIFEYKLCPECNPKVGDKIIAKVSREGIKIHTMNCDALEHMSYDKILKAHWNGYEPENYIFYIKIGILDKPGTLLKFLSMLSDLNINIKSINVNKEKNPEQITEQENKYSIIELELEFANPSKIQFLLKELKNKENYLKLLERKLY